MQGHNGDVAAMSLHPSQVGFLDALELSTEASIRARFACLFGQIDSQSMAFIQARNACLFGEIFFMYDIHPSQEGVFVTGSVDKTARLWDLRFNYLTFEYYTIKLLT